jgi:FdrA protein
MAFQSLIKTRQPVESVTLMSITLILRDISGIEEAALLMGTDANKRFLAQAGMSNTEMDKTSPYDLIIAVRGDEDIPDVTIAKAEGLMASSTVVVMPYEAHHPMTVRSVCLALANANFAVISVAGQYAAAVAWATLRQGLHVLLFSDNVSLEDEIAFKQQTVENDLLMLCPGAGTAILNGMAL